MRVGVACFFLSAIALRSRWRLCRLTDAAYPLRVLRAFGADAVRGCGERWVVGTRPHFYYRLFFLVTVKNTPSKGRHPQSPPTAAARWCAYLQGCTCPAYCGSNSGNRSTTEQVCRSPSFAHRDKRPTTKNALGTARLPSPAPARSAVNRMSSVTTGHQAAQCSNYLHSKIERRLPPSLHPKALFFFSTVHGALLFLRTRRKRRGGCIPFHEKEKVPSPGKGHPRFPEREKLTPRRGASPIPRQRKHPLS